MTLTRAMILDSFDRAREAKVEPSPDVAELLAAMEGHPLFERVSKLVARAAIEGGAIGVTPDDGAVDGLRFEHIPRAAMLLEPSDRDDGTERALALRRGEISSFRTLTIISGPHDSAGMYGRLLGRSALCDALMEVSLRHDPQDFAPCAYKAEALKHKHQGKRPSRRFRASRKG